MTIDERLEALTQTVELLAVMHKDSEARFETFVAEMRENSADIRRAIDRLENTVNRLEQVSRAIGRVVLEHEDRIRDIEQRNQ